MIAIFLCGIDVSPTYNRPLKNKMAQIFSVLNWQQPIFFFVFKHIFSVINLFSLAREKIVASKGIFCCHLILQSFEKI